MSAAMSDLRVTGRPLSPEPRRHADLFRPDSSVTGAGLIVTPSSLGTTVFNDAVWKPKTREVAAQQKEGSQKSQCAGLGG